MFSQQYNASFDPLVIFGAVNPWGLFVAGQVRTDTTGLLASVVVTFDWVDTNGSRSQQVSLSLTSLSASEPFSFPVFSTGNQYLTVSGELVGTATFTLQYGFVVL